MKRWIIYAASAAAVSAPASADTVCEWMEFAQAIQTAAAPPATAPRTPDHERAQTQVALAMFEALNAIDRRYESYLGFAQADSTASQDAAAATAAYEVLVSHFPSQKTALDDSYAIVINEIGDKRSRDFAIADAKLHYNFWRPVTAIRNGELDGIAATEADKGWEPLINTPNHPEYPCGHCIFAAANAEFMKAEVGGKPAYGVRVASRSIPNAAVQALPSWDEWVRQVSYSRTLGGVHYRFSNEVAEEMGRKIARLAMAKVMRPLPRAPRSADR